MTLTQILYFKTVAKTENFHKAAEQLYVSQPSLSRSISALEEELGVALFEKEGRGIVLTKAGKLFLEHAERIAEDCNIATNKMHKLATDGGKVEIGYVFPMARHFIPQRARNFLNLEGNEHVSFNFWQNHTPAIVDRVKSGDLDIGFGGITNNNDLEFYPVLTEELVFITPKDHPLAAQDEISIEEINNYPLISYDKESWMGIHMKPLYRKFHVDPNVIIECSDEYSIVALVAHGFGISVCPKYEVVTDSPDIVIHPIKEEPIYHQIFMFWLKDRYHIPAVQHFIEYMKENSEGIDSDNVSKLYLKDIIHY